MDITSATTAAASGSGQSAIVVSMIKSTENLAAIQASILMASLGVGTNVDVHA